MTKQDPTHRDIFEEIRELRRENADLHEKIGQLKESTDKFDRLHSMGRTAVILFVGIGGLVLFALEVARSIKHLFH